MFPFEEEITVGFCEARNCKCYLEHLMPLKENVNLTACFEPPQLSIISVNDLHTEEPISGATVSLFFNDNGEEVVVVEDVETNVDGLVEAQIVSNGTYRITVEKENYIPFKNETSMDCNFELNEHGSFMDCDCFLDIRPNLTKISCIDPLITMTVVIKNKRTLDGIMGANVTIIEGQRIVAEGLITNENGKVQLPILDDGEYEIIASAPEYETIDTVEAVSCDVAHCDLCEPFVVLELPEVVYNCSDAFLRLNVYENQNSKCRSFLNS